MKELTIKVVSTLKNMTPEKQRHVLRLFQAKLANTTIRPEGPAFLSSPCHAWILPEEDLQRVPQLRIGGRADEFPANFFIFIFVPQNSDAKNLKKSDRRRTD
jgi:hypothetical protein